MDGVNAFADALRAGRDPKRSVTLFAFKEYFPAVATTDVLSRVADVLCCKPSELAFYPVPKLMIRRVGDHEARPDATRPAARIALCRAHRTRVPRAACGRRTPRCAPPSWATARSSCARRAPPPPRPPRLRPPVRPLSPLSASRRAQVADAMAYVAQMEAGPELLVQMNECIVTNKARAVPAPAHGRGPSRPADRRAAAPAGRRAVRRLQAGGRARSRAGGQE
jgi:hypothetical protein